MNPGEFVVDSFPTRVEYVMVAIGEGLTVHRQVHPDDPLFPAAVAALQSLLPHPTVHPANEARSRVEYHGAVKEWCGGPSATATFTAGREYERRQG